MMDDMTVEIIADGVHLPASLLKYVCKFKGPDKIALVTDSMRGGIVPCVHQKVCTNFTKITIIFCACYILSFDSPDFSIVKSASNSSR